MSFVNFSTKEITSKIVYYGPGLCGKTTTLQYIYESIVPENKGQMVSLATDVDRTIYFDFLPLKLGKIQDFSVRIQLYTVPGQVRYNSTRQLVLSGTDGVVFIADSQRDLLDEDLHSFRSLVDNLADHGLPLDTLPHIYQYNKRDLPNLLTVDQLNGALNPARAPWFETCATTGEGVLEGLKAVSRLVMGDLNRKGVIKRRKFSSSGMVRANLTDTMLRPVIGPVSSSTVNDVTGAVEEYENTVRPRDLIAPSEGSHGPANSLEFTPAEIGLAAAHELRRQARSLTLSALFDDAELAARLLALEEAIATPDASNQVQKLARDMFAQLIEDPRFFPPDMGESARISMLGISLRKYAHFYRLLSQLALDHAESLFLLHFLVDVHFGKGMP